MYYLNKYTQLFLLIGVIILANPLFADDDTEPPASEPVSEPTSEPAPEPASAADLSISIDEPSPNKVVVGNGLNYVLNITNNGPDAATDVQVQYPFSPAMDIGDIAGENWVCDKPTTTCNLTGDLGVGNENAVVITIPVTVPVDTASGLIELRASVSGSNDEPNDDNSATNKDVTVSSAEADLSITPIRFPEAVYKGESARYTIKVSNAGKHDAQKVLVTNTFSPNVTYIGFTGEGWQCGDMQDMAVTCEFTTLHAPESEQSPVEASLLSIDVTGQSGKLTVGVNVSSDAVDTNPANDFIPSQDIAVFTYTTTPETGVAPDNVFLEASFEGLEFAWKSGDQCLGQGGNINPQLVAERTVLKLLVIEGSVNDDCSIPEGSKVVATKKDIIVDLEENIPPAAQLVVTKISDNTFKLDASGSKDAKQGEIEQVLSYRFSSDKSGKLVDWDGNGEHVVDLPNGEYSITVVVKDDKGGTTSSSAPVNVGESTRPLANFTIPADAIFNAPMPESVDLIVNNDDQTIVDFVWKIVHPNGEVKTESLTANEIKSVNFKKTGNYHVTLAVYNNLGNFSEITKNIYVGSYKTPTVKIHLPRSIQKGSDIKLDSKSTFSFNDPDDVENEYGYKTCEWEIEGKYYDCGDEESHTFDNPVEVKVVIRTTDKDYDPTTQETREQGSATDTVFVHVYGPDAPKVEVSVEPRFGFAPLTVHAIGEAIDPNNNNKENEQDIVDRVTFSWDSDSAPMTPQDDSLEGKIFISKVDITFEQVRDYEIAVTATDDSDTNQFSISEPEHVKVVDVPNITADPPPNCESLYVNFGIDSPPYINDFRYTWSSNNEQVQISDANSPNPIISFPENAILAVNLTVTELKGDKRSISALPLQVSTMCEVPIIEPIADMAVVTQPAKGFSPLVVTVEDRSFDRDGEIVTTQWITSGLVEEVYNEELDKSETKITFWESGTPEIKVTVWDNHGATATSLPKKVEVTAIPEITTVPTVICPSTTVTLAVTQEEGFIYEWSSENGKIADGTGAIWLVAFEQADIVNLKITDPHGTFKNVAKPIAFSPECGIVKPDTDKIVGPNGPISENEQVKVNVNEPLKLDASGLTPNGLTYNWFIGNEKQNCSEPICSFTFDQAGEFDVELKVSTQDGSEISESFIVTATSTSIDITVKIEADKQVEVNKSLSVDASKSTPDGMTYKWFVNGIEHECSRSVCTFIFAQTGEHNIELEVSTQDGSEKSESIKVTVLETEITISINANEQVNVNDPLRVDASESTPDGMTYKWFIGEVEQVCSGPICSFTFEQSGEHYIGLEVSTQNGVKKSESFKVTVISIPPTLKAEVNASPLTVQVGKEITFDGGSSTGAISTRTWFVDGVAQEYDGPVFYRTFDTAGNYDIRLEVTDQSTSHSDTAKVTVKDKPQPLKAVVDASPTTVYVGQKVKVSGSESTGDNIKYAWFIDSKQQDCTRPTCYFTFDNAGNYDIELEITNQEESDTDVVEVIVDLVPPALEAVFTVSQTDVYVGQRVIKVNGSESTGNIGTYKWSIYNDMQGCSRPICYFDFDKEGQYDLTLEVVDNVGNTDIAKEVTITVNVIPPPLEAKIYVASNIINIGEKTKIDGSKSTGNIADYRWFIDGELQACKRPVCYFTFDKAGSYFVELEIVDENGETDTDSVELVVPCPPELGELQMSPPKEDIYVGTPVTITANVLKCKDSIKTYDWFVDGNPVKCSNYDQCSLTFDKAVLYDIEVEVANDYNQTDKKSVVIDQVKPKPCIDIEVVPPSVEIEQSIKAFVKPMCQETNSGNIDWFVDGVQQECVRDTCYFSFDKAGNHEVVAEVSGLRASKIVMACSKKDVKLEASREYAAENQQVEISIEASSCFKDNIETITWFINGETKYDDDEHNECKNSFGDKSTFELICSEQGEYVVTADIRATDGQLISVPPEQGAMVVVTNPVADIQIPDTVPTSGTVPHTIELDVSNSRGAIAEFKVQISDGRIVTFPFGTVPPKITFDKCGTYTIDLTVTGENGKGNTMTSEVIHVGIPEGSVCFHPLPPDEAKPGDTLTLNLNVDFDNVGVGFAEEKRERCKNSEIWVALDMPDNEKMTPMLFLSHGEWFLEPQRYAPALQYPTKVPYNVFKYNFEETYGLYIFYTALVEKDGDPMPHSHDTDLLLEYLCSNLASDIIEVSRD